MIILCILTLAAVFAISRRVKLSVLWCRLFHEGIYRGAQVYECAVCFKAYANPWTPESKIPEGAWRQG